ncbi:MAG: YjbQ family protein [Candidatus Wildermuthbacteria bacterium]|nr:YjbQ family protein [Candidatus Wildermuthbacteria bacterium]
MQKLVIKTQKNKEVVDITETINKALSKMDADNGLCHLFLTHTTASLATADLDPGTDLDMLEAYDAMVPELNYRHPHDPAHVPDHILSTMLGTGVWVPVEKKKLVLGLWQKVVLFEFEGPRDRQVILNFIKTE